MVTKYSQSADYDYLTIVSGLPRSGTSMMMRMLDIGGLPVVTDELRQADEDNPRGYYEFAPALKTKEDPSWLNNARGSVVKMIYKLLHDLPDSMEYRVILMRRDLSEILESQKVMLGRMGKEDNVSDDVMGKFFQLEMDKFCNWTRKQPNFSMLEVSYNELVKNTEPVVAKVAAFLDRPLNQQAMCQVVDSSLYRNRAVR